MSMVIATEKSANRKIGPVSTTYASQASCPKSCPFFNNGCYAEGGLVGIHTAKLNKATTAGTRPIDVARAEAAAIGTLSGTRPMRLHIVGDCRTVMATLTVAKAVREYIAKAGQKVWTYTHAWRKVPRIAWDGVSVLASCENTTDAKKAMKRGYAAAIVVDHHESDKAYKVDGLTVIPCPEQTGKAASCADCRLCWNDTALRNRSAVIAFAAHGYRVKNVKQAVNNT